MYTPFAWDDGSGYVGGMRHYLDWNATAVPDEVVVALVADAWREDWGNASSLHREGKRAAEAAQRARVDLATATASRDTEWILCGGATEALNMGILGTWLARKAKGAIVTSAGEHSATLGVLDLARQLGAQVRMVGLDRSGCWNPDEVLAACSEGASLVSLLWANNETGAISEVEGLAKELAKRRIPLLLDATQCFGRMSVDLSRISADLVALSGHKFGAPKGIGALFLRAGTPWIPWLRGGGQERNRRGGTTNAVGAVGLSAALARFPSAGMLLEMDLRQRNFESKLLDAIPGSLLVAQAAKRLPNTTCVVLEGVDSESLLSRLDTLGFAVSSGSACTSGKTEPSHVLTAMGLSEAQAHGAIRISTGPSTPDASLDALLAVLPEEVARIRGVGK
jgi:cysteine desulfurase